MEEYLDTSAMARKFNIAESTIEYLRRDGRIPAFKVGRQYRYDLREVDKALKEKITDGRDKR